MNLRGRENYSHKTAQGNLESTTINPTSEKSYLTHFIIYFIIILLFELFTKAC